MNVTLQNLTKRFPARGKKGEEVVAVNCANIEIKDGELIGLLGPSGCGKSTVLNLICGLLQPSDGQILFGDDDVTTLPPEKRGIGLVFQNYALYPHLTVLQNILFPLENLKGKDKLTKEGKEQESAAEAIENNIRKKVVQKIIINPAYYSKMSEVLEQLILDRKRGVIVSIRKNMTISPRSSNMCQRFS